MVRLLRKNVGSCIRVKIDERVTFADFTVGVTSNKNQADFIITNSIVSDFTIKASEDVFLPVIIFLMLSPF